MELLGPDGLLSQVTKAVLELLIGNSDEGFTEAIDWIVEQAPGLRVVIGLEGTRSYGIGLARACIAAGLTVVEVERPKRAQRRKGKSDPIDAMASQSAPTR